MRHYTTPPGFDPSVMIDVDALRKELIDDADTGEDTMMLEEDEDNEQSGMKIE